jgi:hypothetical protein
MAAGFLFLWGTFNIEHSTPNIEVFFRLERSLLNVPQISSVTFTPFCS